MAVVVVFVAVTVSIAVVTAVILSVLVAMSAAAASHRFLSVCGDPVPAETTTFSRRGIAS